jgi:hypothetical protein
VIVLADVEQPDPIAGLLILGLLICVNFIPTAVAQSRGRSSLGAIFALNFFLGWTVVGWVWALVWALTDDPKRVVALAPVTSPTTRVCPSCISEVPATASVCRYCQRDLPADAVLHA